MQDIVDRITKLLALATSPNEHEAAAAAAKAQEILTEHNLRLEDIKTEHKSPDIPIQQVEIDSSGRRFYWKGSIANALANANFCTMWWLGGRVIIVGRNHNVAIVKSLYDYLTNTVKRLAAQGVEAEKQAYVMYLAEFVVMGIKPSVAEPNWRTWKYSFITGCTKRLAERIEEQTRRMNAEGIPNTAVTGLACRMAHEREQEAISLWRREQGISVTRRKSGSKARVTRDGYTAGQRAGDSISLERQLSSSSGQLLR